MAHADLKHYIGGGPAIANDVDAYTEGAGVAVVNPGGGADPYFEIDDTAATSVVLGLASSVDSSTETYHFALASVYFPAATIDAGDVIDFFQVGSSSLTLLKAVQSTGTSFTIRLTADLTDYDGTTEYAADTWHTFLVELDGSNIRVHNWSGSAWSQEISAAETNKFEAAPVYACRGDGLAAGEKYRLKKILLCGSDNRAASPDGNGAFVAAFPSAEHTQQYGDDANCNAGQTSGSYLDVDDWATGATNTADHICEHASEGGRFLAEYTNPTVPSGFYGADLRAQGSANVNGKTTTTSLTLSDGTTHVDRQVANLADTTWRRHSSGYHQAPSGNAWDQTEWNATKGGVKSTATNGANDRWSAFAAELCGVGNATLPPLAAVGMIERGFERGTMRGVLRGVV